MSDTIAAIATAPGAGGVGVIRLSGPQSSAVLQAMFRPWATEFSGYTPWKLYHGRVVDRKLATLDDALAVVMPGPRSFTGEDVVELHCHGGPALLDTVLEEVCSHGVRQAERGEFTRRAFLNGRMDLSQAEAVAELIAAPSKQGVRLAVGKLEGLLGQRMGHLRSELEWHRAQICLAVDFPDDEVEALNRNDFLLGVQHVRQAVDDLLAGVERTRCWREGITVALAGPVNAGKSSLMNALLGRTRAIVTPHAGTTRDYLEESVVLDGLHARLVDTAGLRVDAGSSAADVPESAACHTEASAAAPCSIEAEGIRLGQERAAEADVVLLVVDGETGQVIETNFSPERTILVWNKADRAQPDKVMHPAWFHTPCAARVLVSAKEGSGLENLAKQARSVALAGLGATEPEPDALAPNARQARSLRAAQAALADLAVDVDGGLPYELCSVRLEEAAHALGEVVGLDSTDDVLNRIFDTFCIGK